MGILGIRTIEHLSQSFYFVLVHNLTPLCPHDLRDLNELGFVLLTVVSRADDIESLLYLLLEFHHGRLPWQDIPAPSSMKHELVYELKTTVIDALLARSPPEFAAYRAHVAGLTNGEEPDYALLRGLFRDTMAREGWAYNWVYDWMDARRLPKGTLLPEEYKASFDFVKDKEYNPHLM